MPRPDPSSRFAIRASLLVLAAAGAWVAVFGCGSSAPPPPPVSDPATLRTTSLGDVQGFLADSGAHVWRGLPFAAPPVNDLRWRAPQEPEPWRGTLEATAHGAPCVQFASPMASDRGEEAGAPSGSEDCLYANVFTPPFGPDEVPTGRAALPVMVWIHGGGNSIGSAHIYDWSAFAAAHYVVVVAVQYRLGAFGWFAHPALRAAAADDLDRSGNFGTLDLVRALEWVSRDIAAFGGDPGRVTVFGESAGGADVFSLLLSPQAGGLFHRAIAQSGGLWTSTRAFAENSVDDPEEPGSPYSSHEILVKALVQEGRAADPDAARELVAGLTHAEIAEFLRGIPARSLLTAYDGSFGGMYQAPQLIRDGTVLPAEPALEAFAAGRYNRVPVILGSNRDESKLFSMFASDAVGRIFGIPLWVRDARFYDLSTQYPSLSWKAQGVDQPAAAMQAVQGGSVYAYRFDWDEQPKLLWLDISQMLGACHALEVPFVMGAMDLGAMNRFLFDEERKPAAEALSQSMMSYWAEFAYSGTPGRGRDGREVEWQAWDGASSGAKFVVFDTQEGGGIRMSDEAVDESDVVRRIGADDRFAGAEERCSVYAELVTFDYGISEDEYPALEDGACARWPLGDPATS